MRTLACLLATACLAALEIGDIPDPRPRGLSDRTGRIARSAQAEIDGIAAAVAAERAGQLVVVVVASTDGRDPRAFGTALFNRWHLGSAARDDGCLVFAALDDRRCEIILGDGIDDAGQVAESQRIFDEVIRPRMRAGDAGGALAAGARACADRILRPAALRGVMTIAPDDRPMPRTSTEADAAPAMPAEETRFVEAPPQTPRTLPQRAPPPWVDEPMQAPGGVSVILPLVLLAASSVVTWLGLRLWLRRRPRICSGCRQPMVRLGEADDDEHLERGERMEERVGSVDYDVWSCTSCGEVLKISYGAWFSSYARCPCCGYRTKSSSSSTLRMATELQEGLVEVHERCVHCRWERRYRQRTPRVQPASRSSSSSFSTSSSSGFSSSSSSSSSGSSSSSSSSSSSGGSSSGGGGGGSW